VKKNKDEYINSKDFASELIKIEKEDPFNVPDGYFEKLANNIQEQVSSRSERIPIIEQILIFLKQPKYSLATGFVIVLIIVGLFVFIKPADKEIQLFSDITIEDILEESPELIYDMDESIILEVLFADNGDDIYNYFENDVFTDTTISDDEIIDYLIDENIETELIYNL